MLELIRRHPRIRKRGDRFHSAEMPCHTRIKKSPRSWFIEKIGFYHLSIFSSVTFEKYVCDLFNRLTLRQKGKKPC